MTHTAVPQLLADPDVLLVTVTDGSPGSLVRLRVQLENLERQGCELQMVLVIRGPADLQLELGARRWIHSLRVPLRTGLSAARNVALRYAREAGLIGRSEMVAFPDDDCVYPPGLLRSVLELARASGAQVLCGAYGPSRGGVDERRFPRRRLALTRRRVPALCSAGTMFVTGPLAAKVGSFDERLGLGGRFGSSEDTDFAVRALNAGGVGVYAPDVVFVEHPYKRERPGQYYTGNVAMLAKHAPRQPRLALSLACRLLIGARLALGGAIGRRQYLGALRAAAVMLARGRRPSAAPTAASGVTPSATALHRTALSLMASSFLTSALGVGFWVLAARLYPARELGIDSALVAAMLTISTVCQLNLSNVIVRFLPQVRAIGRRVIQAYGTAMAASLVAAILFVLAAPALSPRFRFLGGDSLLASAFVLGLVAWTIFSLQDSVLTALGRPTWLPIENGLFSFAKIAALPVGLALLGTSSHGVFIAWVIPMWLTVPAINWLIIRRVVPFARVNQRAAPGVLEVVGRRRLVAFLGQDLVGAVFGQATAAAIPLLVLASLGSEANAYFFIPYTLITAFDLMFLAVATSLTAEGARDESAIGELVRRVARRFIAREVPVVALIILLAPLLLAPFGPAYVEHGVLPLRLMAAASCCRSVLFLFSSVARLQRRGIALIALQATSAVLLVGLMVLVAPRWGVDGVAGVWLAVHGVLAAVVVPSLVRVTRRPAREGAGSRLLAASAEGGA